MVRRPSPPPISNPPPAGAVLAALVLVAAAILAVVSLAGGSWDAGQAPFPFAWRDVALVYAASAAPLAVILAGYAGRRLPAAGAAALAAAALAAGVAPLTGMAREDVTAAITSEPYLGVLVRAAAALGPALAVALSVAVLGARRGPDGERFPLAAALVAGVVLLVPPATYAGARCRHDVGQLGEYLGQSRFGEARALARGLLVLDAGRQVQGHPLPEVAADVERVMRELEGRVGSPLSLLATPGERLNRARHLAMLGRTDEALQVLDKVRDPAAAPDAENLRGTVHETRGEWEPALAAYRTARAEWERRPPSPGRAAGLLRATTGVAYCQRKSGHYPEAEEAYREVLALSPTAESHFLLAQFYEDAQQAGKAREHARRAMALAPDRYRQEGEKLIRKLTVSHFGCLGVYAAEGEEVTAP